MIYSHKRMTSKTNDFKVTTTSTAGSWRIEIWEKISFIYLHIMNSKLGIHSGWNTFHFFIRVANRTKDFNVTTSKSGYLKNWVCKRKWFHFCLTLLCSRIHLGSVRLDFSVCVSSKTKQKGAMITTPNEWVHKFFSHIESNTNQLIKLYD